ncbi:TPA: type II toxin-antitoxin system RelE/ParE family toxin [Klebsiella pneumoniae]
MHIDIHPAALDELADLPPPLHGKMMRQIDRLAEFGTELREPHTKPLRDGFFELRAKAGTVGRAIFVYRKGAHIFILKIFVKDTQKTPPAVLKAAAVRLEEMIDD